MSQRVVVLGGSGMLGSMLVSWLTRDADFEVVATARSESVVAGLKDRLAGVTFQLFDAADEELVTTSGLLRECDWVVNAIGIIKPFIHDDNAAEVENAVRVNALFPHVLANRTAGASRVLQIATDCV